MSRKAKRRREGPTPGPSLRLRNVEEERDQGVIASLAATSWIVHILLLVLAGLIQWSIWRSVEDQLRVEFITLSVEIDPDALLEGSTEKLGEEWVLAANQDWEQPTVVLSGPRQEISRYRDELQRQENEGLATYALTVRPKDLSGVEPGQKRAQLTFQLNDFRPRESLRPSDEVKIEFADSDRDISVAVERRVELPVRFRVGSFTVPKGYEPVINIETEGSVRAPWSAIQSSQRRDGAVLVDVTPPDFMREFDAAGLSDSERWNEWQKMIRTSGEGEGITAGVRRTLLIQKNDRMTYLDAAGKPIDEVTVTVLLKEKSNYKQLQFTADFDYVLPAWMIGEQKTLEIVVGDGLQDSGVIALRVSSDQQSDLEQYFRLVLDLSTIQRGDPKFLPSELSGADPRSRSATWKDFPIRLEVDRSKVSYLPWRPDAKLNEAAYLTRDITITFTANE